MKNDLVEHTLSSFFSLRPPLKKPLLLGFSGGVDSLALAHALFLKGVEVHLAHFDHRWRKESQDEVKLLAKWAKERDLIFLTEASTQPKADEMWAREERYAFFGELFASGDYEALVLAHQLDDQAETVLKRVFEGAHLANLRGMEPVSKRGEMPLWRPFLPLPKKAIRAFADKNELDPLEDRTNFDEKYMRARMRQTIVPEISRHFGKEVAPPLFRLGQEASELRAYIERATQKFATARLEGPFGVMWDFTLFFPLETVELRYLLHAFFKERGKGATRVALDAIIQNLQLKTPNYKIQVAKSEVIIDRGLLFYLERPFPHFKGEVPLKAHSFISGDWEWTITMGAMEEPLQAPNWKDWWKGKISLSSSSLEWQSQSKIPSFFQAILPLFMPKNESKREALTSDSPILVTISVKPRA